MNPIHNKITQARIAIDPTDPESLKKTQFNPWTGQEETQAQAIIETRINNLENEKIQLQLKIYNINAELEKLNSIKT